MPASHTSSYVAQLVGLALLLGGCGDEADCLAGSRICGGEQGNVIMLCTTAGVFEAEQTCSVGCQYGACTKTPNFQFGQDATRDSTSMDSFVFDVSIADTGPMDLGTPIPDIPLDTGKEDIPMPSDPGNIPDPGPMLDIAVDTGPEDTGPIDVGPTDTGPTDTGPPDAGPLDTGPPDTGPPDVGPPDVGPILDPLGALAYEKIPNIAVTGSLHAVRWNVDGAFALLLGTSGKVARYEPDMNLALETDLSASTNAIARRPEGGFLIVGDDGGPTVWSVTEPTPGAALEFTVVDTPMIGTPVEIIPAGPVLTWVIATRQPSGGSTINRIYVWHETKGVLGSRAYPQSGDPTSSYAGIWSVMMADPNLYAGSQAVVTAEGLNGSGSHTWIVETDLLVDNDFSNGYGNAGKAAWRPDGTFGMVLQAYGPSVYVFDGTWTKTTVPNANSGAAGNDIAWTEDGRRALVVSRATGNPLYGIISEYRAEDSVSFDPLRWVSQAIPDFDDSPFNGSFNTHLLGVDWRPNSACAEGLIGASASSLSMVIRYRDTADPDCAAF